MRTRLMRLLFLISIEGLLTTDLLGQEDSAFTHLHKSSKTIVRYKFVHRNDSTFIHGLLTERKASVPIFNMNIGIPLDRIGTVPNEFGHFIMFLPKDKGILSFDKISFDRFEFQYDTRSIR